MDSQDVTGMKSLLPVGYRTDLFFLDVDCITRGNGCYVIRTPNRPGYYFGNFLLLDSPPTKGSKAYLEGLFQENFKDIPGIKHVTLCWNGCQEFDHREFTENGYVYSEYVVLIADSRSLIEPQVLNPEIDIRPLHSSDDVEQWIDFVITQRDITGTHYGTDGFIRQAVLEYMKQRAQGLGTHYGAFIDSDLVGIAGLYIRDGVGRFQQVTTDYRRYNQGICKTLLHTMSVKALGDAKELVIIADNNYHAARLYEDLGFIRREYQSSMYWWPRNMGG